MRDLGDYQTPPGLVAAVLDRLGPVGRRWPRVLEPTCGRGHFLAGLLALDPPPREVQGVELQPGHLDAAREMALRSAGPVRVGLTGANLFDLDLARALDWQGGGPLLVVGNPPWVTNSGLGALGSGNRPRRVNAANLRGIDAMTGSSNFDIAEAVWVKVLVELAAQQPTVALLCKTAVARRVLEHADRAGLPVAAASVFKLDARAWFGASVDACLLCVTLGPAAAAVSTPAARPLDRVPVYDRLDAAGPSGRMGFVRGRLVADLDAYAAAAGADGLGPIEWRQGLKHDLAGVMELTEGEGGVLRNRTGEAVDVEPEYVYPLLKGSDLARPGPVRAATRRVIVTQRSVGEDTAGLRAEAPRLWAYLNGHAGGFAARKSSVYRGRPPFSMFGVGPYTFSPFKVAVSGLHRAAAFHAVGPVGGRPTMLDDTAYFLPCRSAEQAALAAVLLNRPEAPALLRALSFPGAKRSVTKAALRRVDLRALLGRADRAAWLAAAGPKAERLGGRPAEWPDRLETLLGPATGPAHRPGPLFPSS